MWIIPHTPIQYVYILPIDAFKMMKGKKRGVTFTLSSHIVIPRICMYKVCSHTRVL